MRNGAGRKAGIQNSDMAERVLISRWFCDWFSRQLKKHQSQRVAVTDAECEDAVNRHSPGNEAIFKDKNFRLGVIPRRRQRQHALRQRAPLHIGVRGGAKHGVARDRP